MNNRNKLEQAFLVIQKTLKASIRKIVSNPHDVDDVVQETYLRAVASNTSESIKDPEAYLFRTSRNIALNQQARMYRQLEVALPTDEFNTLSDLLSERPVEDELECKQQFAEFCLAVSDLPIKCRKVFVLRKVYGLSQKEIAQKLNISISTVETHVSKGMLKMRLSMGQTKEKSSPESALLEKSDVNYKSTTNVGVNNE